MSIATQDFNRRHFLKQAGATLGAASIAPAALASEKSPTNLADADWQQIREQFPLQRGLTHMAGFFADLTPQARC